MDEYVDDDQEAIEEAKTLEKMTTVGVWYNPDAPDHPCYMLSILDTEGEDEVNDLITEIEHFSENGGELDSQEKSLAHPLVQRFVMRPLKQLIKFYADRGELDRAVNYILHDVKPQCIVMLSLEDGISHGDAFGEFEEVLVRIQEAAVAATEAKEGKGEWE